LGCDKKERKKMKRYYLFVLLLLLCSVIGFSSVEDEEEREYLQPLEELFISESVYPQEAGEIQLSFLTIYNKSKVLDNYGFPLTIEYGITDSLQVEVELNSFKEKGTFRFNQIEIGTKYSFMNIKGLKLHSAVGFEIGFPIRAADDDEESSLSYEPFLILAKDFPGLNNLQFFTELRLEIEDEFKEFEIGWNVGIFVPIGRFCIVSELNFINIDEKEVYITPGLIWNLPGSWELMIGFPLGLNDNSDKFRLILGLTFEFDTK
jgi:hypothetical protein